MSSSTSGVRHQVFATTQWSVVMSAGRAGDEASRQALEILCGKYWPALYGYVRRRGHSAEDARDLTQEFFLRLLEHNWLGRADPSKGRFRSFILTVLKRFLADEWDKSKTQKRGGNVALESLSDMAESVYSTQGAATGGPELEFERDWALALLSNVLHSLEQEYAGGGKGDLFCALRPYLSGGSGQRPYALAAPELGMTDGAFKVAVCRIRQRYREKMREEVAATLAHENDVETELRHLYRILVASHD